MIRFTRTTMFLSGLLFIIGIYVVYKFTVIALSETTTGTVEAYQTWLSEGRRYNRIERAEPVIAFKVGNEVFRFNDGSDAYPPIGEEVPVLYRRSDPSKAYLYTFASYWFHPILILPIIAWGVVVVGIGRNGSFWTLYWRRMKVVRTEIQKRRDWQ